MLIFVQILTGQKFPLEVEPSENVWNVKVKMQDKVKIPPNQQRLICDGKILKGEGILKDYNIQEESIFHLSVRLGGGGPEPPILLTVKTISGFREITIHVYPNETVESFKAKVPMYNDFPVKQLRMTCKCSGIPTLMEDDREVSEYEIDDETVYLVLMVPATPSQKWPHMKIY